MCITFLSLSLSFLSFYLSLLNLELLWRAWWEWTWPRTATNEEDPSWVKICLLSDNFSSRGYLVISNELSHQSIFRNKNRIKIKMYFFLKKSNDAKSTKDSFTQEKTPKCLKGWKRVSLWLFLLNSFNDWMRSRKRFFAYIQKEETKEKKWLSMIQIFQQLLLSLLLFVLFELTIKIWKYVPKMNLIICWNLSVLQFQRKMSDRLQIGKKQKNCKRRENENDLS